MRVITIVSLLASAFCFGSGGVAASSLSVNSRTTAPYDPKIASEAVYYAKAAYCDSKRIADWSCPACKFNPGMKDVSVFTERETQAYVGYDSLNNNVVVAIRGSSNIQNWIDNLTFELVPYQGCPSSMSGGCGRVHKGFYEIYKALSAALVPAVRSVLAAHPDAFVFVTGHSLGGAMATLTSIELSTLLTNRTVYTYNFGAPRIGDVDFTRFAVAALAYKGQFHVTHKEDPVPRLPPQLFSYAHVPQEVFYNNDGNTTFTVCHDEVGSEDPQCCGRYPLGFSVSDHVHYLGISTQCAVNSVDLMLRGMNPNMASMFNEPSASAVV